MKDLSHIPTGYHSVTPSLTCRDAPAALKFYHQAFDAEVTLRLDDKEPGKIAHSEFRIGNSTLMLSSEYPDFGSFAPEIGQGAAFMIYVPDCDAAYQKALDAGAESTVPPTDQFWGDRTASISDPHGYRWSLAQKVKDMSEEEVGQAAQEWIEKL
jgi:uncharacterized glyoxalase superfamily protein PhnB